MTATPDFVVDFVTRGRTPDEWRLVLVEEGPWAPPFDDRLHKMQKRLYDCVDAVLDGQLAQKLPDSLGKRIVIQVDGYRLPRDEVASFFNRFAAGALATGQYQEAVAACPYTSAISFELNFG